MPGQCTVPVRAHPRRHDTPCQSGSEYRAIDKDEVQSIPYSIASLFYSSFSEVSGKSLN